MYKCKNCDVISKPKEPLNLVVVQTRSTEYTNQDEEGDTVRSSGIETIKEIGVCDECKKRYDKIHAK